MTSQFQQALTSPTGQTLMHQAPKNSAGNYLHRNPYMSLHPAYRLNYIRENTSRVVPCSNVIAAVAVMVAVLVCGRSGRLESLMNFANGKRSPRLLLFFLVSTRVCYSLSSELSLRALTGRVFCQRLYYQPANKTSAFDVVV